MFQRIFALLFLFWSGFLSLLCMVPKGELDRQRDDQAQMEWIREYQKRKSQKQKFRKQR